MNISINKINNCNNLSSNVIHNIANKLNIKYNKEDSNTKLCNQITKKYNSPFKKDIYYEVKDCLLKLNNLSIGIKYRILPLITQLLKLIKLIIFNYKKQLIE